VARKGNSKLPTRLKNIGGQLFLAVRHENKPVKIAKV
jgi:hypothetical protein